MIGQPTARVRRLRKTERTIDEPKKRAPLTEADRVKNMADTFERVEQEKHFCPTHGQLTPEDLSKAYARRRVIRCRKCENARSSAQKTAKKA